jgi:hypothetical protein
MSQNLLDLDGLLQICLYLLYFSISESRTSFLIVLHECIHSFTVKKRLKTSVIFKFGNSFINVLFERGISSILVKLASV